MRKYEATLWPDNQPPILLGYYTDTTKANVKRRVCQEHRISLTDTNLTVILYTKNTPYKAFNKNRRA